MIPGAMPSRAQWQTVAATQMLNAAPTEIVRSDSASLRRASFEVASADVASMRAPAAQTAPPDPVSGPARPVVETPRKANPIYFALAAAIVLLIAGGGWFYLQGTSPAQQIAPTETKTPDTYVPAGSTQRPPQQSSGAPPPPPPVPPPSPTRS